MDTIVIATEENKNPLRLVFCDVDVASSISQPQAFYDIFEGGYHLKQFGSVYPLEMTLTLSSVMVSCCTGLLLFGQSFSNQKRVCIMKPIGIQGFSSEIRINRWRPSTRSLPSHRGTKTLPDLEKSFANASNDIGRQGAG